MNRKTTETQSKRLTDLTLPENQKIKTMSSRKTKPLDGPRNEMTERNNEPSRNSPDKKQPTGDTDKFGTGLDQLNFGLYQAAGRKFPASKRVKRCRY